MGFYEVRKEDHRPDPAAHGAWVVAEEEIEVSIGGSLPVKAPKLIAGCAFYPCPPFLICEYVSTRPGERPKLVHAACQRIAMAIRWYGAMTGCRQLTFPKHKGVSRMLRKAGFMPVKEQVHVLWGPPWVPVGSVEFSGSAEKSDSAKPGSSQVTDEPGQFSEDSEPPPTDRSFDAGALELAKAMTGLEDAILERIDAR